MSKTVPERYLKPVPDPRSPGVTERPCRVADAFTQFHAQVRREATALKLAISDEDIASEADRRLKALLAFDPEFRTQWEKLAPSSTAPHRDGLVPLVEVAAIRRLTEHRRLEAALKGASGSGRPSDRALPMAVFARQYLETGRPQIRSNVIAFLGSDGVLDWAYSDPVSNSTCGVSERTVRDTMPAMLDRHDPEFAVVLNIDAIQKLATRHKDVARWCCVDGTDVAAWLDQGPDYSEEHKALRNRGMEKAGFGSHGDHFWRGHTLLVLTDLKTSLPLAWLIVPNDDAEYRHVPALLDLLYRHWPECPLEYIVADRAFHVEALYRDLEECYGVHLVTPWKHDSTGKDGGPGDLGTPYCVCSGAPKAMTYVQPEYFWPSDKRRAKGIEPGVRIDLKKSKAGHRWRCDDCGLTQSTRFHNDPRRHAFLPWEGKHAWRIHMRGALGARRNTSESVFFQVKHRGVAGRGVEVPRWVRTYRHVGWLTGCCLLGLTLRRIAHETGVYAECHREAVASGLLKDVNSDRGNREPLRLAA